MSATDPHGIPWSELIIPQAVNFALFVGLLVYFVRTPLQQYFSGKSEEFEKQKRMAEKNKIEAEKHNFEIHTKLNKLEETTASELSKARDEAKALREKMILEAERQAKKQEEEASKMAQFEYARALASLRQELILSATTMAESTLKSEVNEKTQGRLHHEFLTKTQAAHL